MVLALQPKGFTHLIKSIATLDIILAVNGSIGISDLSLNLSTTLS